MKYSLGMLYYALVLQIAVLSFSFLGIFWLLIVFKGAKHYRQSVAGLSEWICNIFFATCVGSDAKSGITSVTTNSAWLPRYDTLIDELQHHLTTKQIVFFFNNPASIKNTE